MISAERASPIFGKLAKSFLDAVLMSIGAAALAEADADAELDALADAFGSSLACTPAAIKNAKPRPSRVDFSNVVIVRFSECERDLRAVGRMGRRFPARRYAAASRFLSSPRGVSITGEVQRPVACHSSTVGSSTTTWLRPPRFAKYMAVSVRENRSSTDSPGMYWVRPMDTVIERFSLALQG